MIVIDGLNKTYPGKPTPALEDVHFDLRNGEILGLVGLNGAGKTTTIRISAGVTLPSHGQVLVDGHDIVRDKVRASEAIGWVPEIFPFAPEARARQLLVYLAGFHRLSGSPADARAREALDKVGLGRVADAPIRTFSQGMRRRFGLAAAMLSDPQNLLLDEILNGLDPEGMAFVRAWVVDLRKQGKGVLLSSHLLSELQALADRVAFLHQGHLLRVVDREELSRKAGMNLHISIDNLDSGAVAFLSTIGSVKIDQKVVLLSRSSMAQAAVTAELVRRGYRVAEIWSEGISLEDFFLQLIRDERGPDGEGS